MWPVRKQEAHIAYFYLTIDRRSVYETIKWNWNCIDCIIMCLIGRILHRLNETAITSIHWLFDSRKQNTTLIFFLLQQGKILHLHVYPHTFLMSSHFYINLRPYQVLKAILNWIHSAEKFVTMFREYFQIHQYNLRIL